MNAPRRHRILMLALAAGLLILAAALAASRWALMQRAYCSQPCQDLGQDIPKEGSGGWTRRYAPRCAPVQLGLELHERRTRVKRRYTLWYKVTLTNVSCYDLSSIYGVPFADSTKVGQWRLVLKDDKGRVLDKLGPPSTYNPGTEFGEVHPYRNDPEALDKLFADTKLGTNDDGFVTLPPGGSITTSASQLYPHTITFVDVPTPVGMGTSRAMIPATLKGIPTPPVGFRVLNDYLFTKAGRYTIHAVIEFDGLSAKPHFPMEHAVPNVMKRLLRFLRIMDEKDVNPTFWKSGSYPVRVESPAIEFEVGP